MKYQIGFVLVLVIAFVVWWLMTSWWLALIVVIGWVLLWKWAEITMERTRQVIVRHSRKDRNI